MQTVETVDSVHSKFPSITFSLQLSDAGVALGNSEIQQKGS